MKILITDLTRMSPGHICAAGVNLETGARVRPVIENEQLSARLLTPHGGPLDVGSIVEFGACQPCGEPPEVEDTRFEKGKPRLVDAMTVAAFMASLRRAAEDSLDVIGPALVRDRDSLVTEKGTGLRSLVLLRAPEVPFFGVYDHGYGDQLRFRWLDGVWLSITDVRLYKGDFKTPDDAKIAALRKAVGSAKEIYLSFGLTRPFAQRGNRHYLQLNNIHVPNWPDWRLSPER